MFVADLYLTLSYFVSFVHDYCDKLTNYCAIIQTYRAIKFKVIAQKLKGENIL